MKITVESAIDGNAPEDPEEFQALGGHEVLRTLCGMDLVSRGCSQESIEFCEPERIGGRWTIKGIGETS